MHRCDICAKSFSSSHTYTRHLSSIGHVQRVNHKATMFTCTCGKTFAQQAGLSRHKAYCTVVNVDSDPEKALMKKEIEELRTQVAMLLEAHASEGNTHTSSNQTNNIENQTNNNTNNTINIHINAFGKENTEYLDDQAIVECIDRIFNSVPAILKRIHFDPDHPENHNIKITNKKLPYASVMGDNRTWKTVNKKDAIESMVAKGYNFLDEKYADTKGRLSKRRQQHFEGFQDKFADEDKEMHKQLMTNVELLVLNQGKD
jgi:hypothetical protein